MMRIFSLFVAGSAALRVGQTGFIETHHDNAALQQAFNEECANGNRALWCANVDAFAQHAFNKKCVNHDGTTNRALWCANVDAFVAFFYHDANLPDIDDYSDIIEALKQIPGIGDVTQDDISNLVNTITKNLPIDEIKKQIPNLAGVTQDDLKALVDSIRKQLSNLDLDDLDLDKSDLDAIVNEISKYLKSANSSDILSGVTESNLAKIVNDIRQMTPDMAGKIHADLAKLVGTLRKIAARVEQEIPHIGDHNSRKPMPVLGSGAMTAGAK